MNAADPLPRNTEIHTNVWRLPAQAIALVGGVVALSAIVGVFTGWFLGRGATSPTGSVDGSRPGTSSAPQTVNVHLTAVIQWPSPTPTDTPQPTATTSPDPSGGVDFCDPANPVGLCKWPAPPPPLPTPVPTCSAAMTPGFLCMGSGTPTAGAGAEG